MSAFTVKVNNAGVTEFLKSASVKSLLQGEADKLAAQANARMARQLPNHLKSEPDRYEPSVKNLTFTAVGRVGATGLASRYDQSKNHTLNALIH